MLKQPHEVEIKGIIACNKCQKEITWHYLVPQKISDGNLCAVSYPDNTILASRKYDRNEDDYIYTVRCPKCDNKISFENEVE